MDFQSLNSMFAFYTLFPFMFAPISELLHPFSISSQYIKKGGVAQDFSTLPTILINKIRLSSSNSHGAHIELRDNPIWDPLITHMGFTYKCCLSKEHELGVSRKHSYSVLIP